LGPKMSKSGHPDKLIEPVKANPPTLHENSPISAREVGLSGVDNCMTTNNSRHSTFHVVNSVGGTVGAIPIKLKETISTLVTDLIKLQQNMMV